jgi:hypothetical protein
MIKNIFLIIFAISLTACNSQDQQVAENTTQSQPVKNSKINGISFVATRNPIDSTAIMPLNDYNANYAAVIPYAWMQSLEHPKINFDEERGWWGEKSIGVTTTIRLMKRGGIEVMLKPQIWIGHGDYTGNIKLESEENWKIIEDSYTDYIMRFVHIAAQENVGLFCIGTELDSFVKARPEYWNKLIKEIRAIYKGKLTYAGNWDSYKYVGFWDQLDYIGVDAYFPVSDQFTPELDVVKKNWKKWKLEMSTLSRKRNKKILFTEYGYISADYAGREPWKNAAEDQNMNEQAQHILLHGLYETVWKEEWMAGGFLWKHHAEDSRHRDFKKRFTPQGKKAQQTVTEAYGKY